MTEARLEHIETLERLGRLVVATARHSVWFVVLDAYSDTAQSQIQRMAA